MPSTKSPRRVTKKSVPSRSTKRRSVKPRAPRSASPAPDASLIAQFAEALGQSSRKAPRTRRRSLADALRQASPAGDILAIMPGARVARETGVARLLERRYRAGRQPPSRKLTSSLTTTPRPHLAWPPSTAAA